jgi:hypothetical protein
VLRPRRRVPAVPQFDALCREAVVLAVFNLLPLPPLDGGRIAVGLLPDVLAAPLVRLEPYGMMILIGVLLSRRRSKYTAAPAQGSLPTQADGSLGSPGLILAPAARHHAGSRGPRGPITPPAWVLAQRHGMSRGTARRRHRAARGPRASR